MMTLVVYILCTVIYIQTLQMVVEFDNIIIGIPPLTSI